MPAKFDNRTLPPKPPVKVWILFGGHDYESARTLAVLGSKEEAEALKQWGEENETGMSDYKRLRWGHDYLTIEEWEIGERSPCITDYKPKAP